MLDRIRTRQFWFQLGSLTAALAGVGVIIARLTQVVQTPVDVGLMVVGLIVGLLCADLASGIVHWLFDTFGEPDTPFFGPNFIKNFRIHHDDPKNITHTDFIQINGDNAFISAIFLWSVIAFGPVETGALSCVLLTAIATTFGFMSIFTNLIHQWAHKEPIPPEGRFFQRIGLAISTKRHDLHHVAPFRTNYCITLGWMNPVMDRLRLFVLAEFLIRGIVRLVTPGRRQRPTNELGR